MKKLKQFLADESGATAIEYGLIAAGISLAIISIVNGARRQAEHQVHLDQHLAEVRPSLRTLARADRHRPLRGSALEARYCGFAAARCERGLAGATPTVWPPADMPS
jgi:Flp/Fap pilin component